MDLRAFVPKQTIEVVIKGLDQQPTDMVVTLAGPSHPATVALDRAQAESRYEAGTLGTRMPYAKAADEVIDELVARTLAWTNVDLDGHALECNPANVRMVYEDADYATFRGQVTRAISDSARFFSI